MFKHCEPRMRGFGQFPLKRISQGIPISLSPAQETSVPSYMKYGHTQSKERK
jgi:hypothetical protein